MFEEEGHGSSASLYWQLSKAIQSKSMRGKVGKSYYKNEERLENQEMVVKIQKSRAIAKAE